MRQQLKDGTNQERAKRRMKGQLEVDRLVAEGGVELDDALLRSAVSIDENMVLMVIDYLRTNGWHRYLRALYEADGQLAWMAKNGEIDYVLTIDSDLLVHNCPRVLMRMSPGGWVDIYDRSSPALQLHVVDEKESDSDCSSDSDSDSDCGIGTVGGGGGGGGGVKCGGTLGREMSMKRLIQGRGVDQVLLYYALLAGNDYASIKGCSPATTLSVLEEVEGDFSIESVLSVIDRRMSKGGKKRTSSSWPGPAVSEVKALLETGLFMFMHQLVYNSKNESMVPLSGEVQYLTDSRVGATKFSFEEAQSGGVGGSEAGGADDDGAGGGVAVQTKRQRRTHGDCSGGGGGGNAGSVASSVGAAAAAGADDDDDDDDDGGGGESGGGGRGGSRIDGSSSGSRSLILPLDWALGAVTTDGVGRTLPLLSSYFEPGSPDPCRLTPDMVPGAVLPKGVSQCSVEQLKAWLATRNCSSTGNKPELQAAVNSQLSIEKEMDPWNIVVYNRRGGKGIADSTTVAAMPWKYPELDITNTPPPSNNPGWFGPDQMGRKAPVMRQRIVDDFFEEAGSKLNPDVRVLEEGFSLIQSRKFFPELQCHVNAAGDKAWIKMRCPATMRSLSYPVFACLDCFPGQGGEPPVVIHISHAFCGAPGEEGTGGCKGRNGKCIHCSALVQVLRNIERPDECLGA